LNTHLSQFMLHRGQYHGLATPVSRISYAGITDDKTCSLQRIKIQGNFTCKISWVTSHRLDCITHMCTHLQTTCCFSKSVWVVCF